MANDPAGWATVLETWCAANVPAGTPVIWDNEPRAGRLEPPLVILSGPHQMVQTGPDELVYEGDAIPVVKSPRRVLYSVRVTNRTQIPRAGVAANYVEAIRQDLARPLRREALKAADMGFVTASTIRRFDAGFDDRVESIAAMDVWFSVVFIARAAADADSPGWIETVAVSSDLEEAGSPPNVTDEIIGPVP